MFANTIDLERVSHGVKTALACLIGFAITQFFSFEIDQWLIITILIVMCAQLSVGSVIQKSYMRFLGTVSGSVIAALAIAFFPGNEKAYAIAIAISAMFFSYIATGKKSYAESGTLGAVTVIIILIGQDPTLKSAFERFLEISLGILIAALVSQFILPVHASKHLRELQAKTIRQLRAFFLVNQIAGAGIENFEDYQKLEEGIAQLLINQRKLSNEAARELLGEEFKTIRFQQLLRAERGIMRSITNMHYILQYHPELRDVFAKSTVLKDFQNSICSLLESIALRLDAGDDEKVDLQIPDMNAVKDYFFSIEHDFSVETKEYMNAYLFSMEMLVDYLAMMLEVVV